MSDYLELYRQFDPPFDAFDTSLLGEGFPRELRVVSRIWFGCGYRPGIAAYLNFFLLRDFIQLHDAAHPPRFRSFRSMADSFYRTDLFIREVTDSGKEPTGGISSSKVRASLQSIMRRHQRLSIPGWMMSCFGYSLIEMVEKQSAPLAAGDSQLHLSYMTTAFRIMGIPFSARRELMERFTRAIEEAHVGLSEQAEKHIRHILLLGEMAGVSSARNQIGWMLPDTTRALFENVYDRVRPGPTRRVAARWLGRLVLKQALGTPRVAVPATD